MEQGLAIRLLGGFAVEIDGEPVGERAWRLRKAKALVKLVALAPERQLHRERAAELLWPDRDAASAVNNFHQALHSARRALGDGHRWLELRDDLLSLSLEATIDVETFEGAAAGARGLDTPAAYERAIELWGGELLPEDRYEAWAEGRRSALRDLYVSLCVELADLHAAAADSAAAIAALQRALVADPLREEAHRALMRRYVAAGRRHQALGQYELLRHALRQELAAEPDADTRALYRELLADAGPARGEQREERQPAGLPLQLTSFVGRARELAELDRLITPGRLLTLTGPGGAGKTRLALAAAAAAGTRFPDGVCFVQLSGLSDPGLVGQAVAGALGVRVPSKRPVEEALAEHLEPRRALIVLDTCEHLVDSCAHLAQRLLQDCRRLALIATSRERLRCPGESAWRVPALSLPDPAAHYRPDEIGRCESVRLFVERAADAAPGFALEDSNAGHLAEICFRLDGMPLAIELAAARIGVLTPAQIAARLEDCLDVLAAGQRTALTRQQTLRATIGWSYDLLGGEERVLFRRLAVFAGGLQLEAAEEVCAGGAIAARDVFELLARLVEKSLVVVEQAGDDARYRLLDTIRQFAAERLEAAGERAGLEARHRAWCQELAAAHDPATAEGARNRSLARLERDHDNLRAALASGLRDDPQAALRLAVTLWRFWLDRHVFVEGARWMEEVLAAVPEDSTLRVEALLARSALDLRLGRTPAQFHRAEDAVAVGRRVGNQRALAQALIVRGLVAAASGALSPKDADDALAGAAGVAARVGADELVASALHARVQAAWYLDDHDLARDRVEEALERLTALRDDETPFFFGLTLGFPVLWEGARGRPRAIYEETILLFHRYARPQAIAHALSNLAYLDRVTGDGEAAQARLADSLARFRAIGDAAGEGLALTHLGNLARSTGRYDEGLTHLEQALAVRTRLGDLRASGVVTGDLALLHSAAGDTPRSDALFEAACRSFRAADDFPALAGTLGNWGACLERDGDLARAAPVLDESSRMWEISALNPRVAWLSATVADVLDTLGRHEEAEHRRDQARAMFAEQGNEHGPAMLGWERARSEA